jgi:hypothetical protein
VASRGKGGTYARPLRHFRLVGLNRTCSGRAVGEGEKSVREPQAHKPSAGSMSGTSKTGGRGRTTKAPPVIRSGNRYFRTDRNRSTSPARTAGSGDTSWHKPLGMKRDDSSCTRHASGATREMARSRRAQALCSCAPMGQELCPILPSWTTQQAGRYLRYTGRHPNRVAVRRPVVQCRRDTPWSHIGATFTGRSVDVTISRPAAEC